MANQKLLSIVIPTYNRCNILPFTVSLFLEQLIRNIEKVEVIICNNASTDDTENVLSSLLIQYEFIRIVNYNDHVEVGESIRRSAANATGHYLLLWSDDDIPSPTLIDTVLIELQKYPDIGCLSFNRIEGYSKAINPIYNLFLTRDVYNSLENIYEKSSEFVEEFFCDMSFMSQNVIKMDCWNQGVKKTSDGYYGFEFMGPLLFGLKNERCLYIDYPLCIERHPESSGNSYGNKWLKYIYIGIPRLLKDLETEGIINDWRRCYCKFHYANNTYVFIKNLYNVIVPEMSDYIDYKDDLVDCQQDKYCVYFAKKALSNDSFSRFSSKGIFYIMAPYLFLRSYPIKKILKKIKNI